MFCLQNLTASPLSMNSDPLAIPVKMGEMFLSVDNDIDDGEAEKQLLRGSNVLRGGVVKIRLCLYMFMFWVLLVFLWV